MNVVFIFATFCIQYSCFENVYDISLLSFCYGLFFIAISA